MPFYQFSHLQKVPTDKATLWDFISSPANLSIITPAELDFKILSKNLPAKMYPGMLIHYHVRPLFGIKINWVTEITQVDIGNYFVDEQRLGPYAMWHHQHFITEIDGGMLMEDIVSYIPPLGFLGSIANTLIVKNELKKIFEFREKAVDKHFGKMG